MQDALAGAGDGSLASNPPIAKRDEPSWVGYQMTRWFSATDRLRAVLLSRWSLTEKQDATTKPPSRLPAVPD